MSNAINSFLAGRQLALDNEERQRQQGLNNTRGKINALLMDPSGQSGGPAAPSAPAAPGAANMGGTGGGAPQQGGQQPARQPSRLDRARQLAMGSGDADLMAQFSQQLGSMQAQERQRQAELFNAVGQVANSMRGVPVAQRAAALRAAAPQLMAMGAPPEEMARYEALLSDPQTSDAVLEALSARVLESQSVFDAYAPQMQGENEVLSRFQGGQQVQGAVNPNAPLNRAIDQQNADATMMNAQTTRDRLALDRENAPQERRDNDFTQERQLRQEFTSITSDYRDIQQSLGTIETMAQREDAQGDLALVVAFTKLLDPGSVAREGEVSLTQSSASTIQQAQNWMNRLRRGNTTLPPEVRAAFLSASQELAGQYADSFQRRQQEYQRIAQDYELNPERITIGGAAQPSADDPLGLRTP